MRTQASEPTAAIAQSYRPRVAIVGGGPGGLFAAWHLGRKAGAACDVTVFEASDRVGGKIITRHFAGVGPYEAGAAEIYDYSALGPDPLRDLIEQELKLEIRHLEGGPCVLDRRIIHASDDLAAHFGGATRDAAKAFYATCARALSLRSYYTSGIDADNAHPWAAISGDEFLEQKIGDEIARRYVRVMAHSDVAAPPHLTNGLTFAKNALMDVPGYLNVFSVVGGNERIVTALLRQIDAAISLKSTVRSIEPLGDTTFRLTIDVNGCRETRVFDYVLLALPLSNLSTIEWRSSVLQQAIDRHMRHFDRPGHYLRATLLFKRPFWREHLAKDWWMMDAFDGCCVYDESARNDFGSFGALAFLIAGNAALALANLSDDEIEQKCLDALPPALHEGRDLVVDSRVHRWMASVNAIPAGLPARPRMINHQPARDRLPGLVMVGDYMFDATLNGLLDSAETGADVITAALLKGRMAHERPASANIAGPSTLEQALDYFLPADSIAQLLRIGWDLRRGARVLHLGSMSGRLVAALRSFGFDAVGVEFSRTMHQRTPATTADFNRLWDGEGLPFDDRVFDAVIETGLYRLAPTRVDRILREIRRVARQGVILGSVTTDLPIALIERYGLREDAQILESRWAWSERLHGSGFDHALLGTGRLERIWKEVVSARQALLDWYENDEGLLYCLYQPDLAEARPAVVDIDREPDLVFAAQPAIRAAE
jgi:monoamine oxidase/SAM-dependent methyltransferase